MPNQEIRLTVPPHLYNHIQEESKNTGNTIAATVRAIIANYYRERRAILGVPLSDQESEPEPFTILT